MGRRAVVLERLYQYELVRILNAARPLKPLVAGFGAGCLGEVAG